MKCYVKERKRIGRKLTKTKNHQPNPLNNVTLAAKLKKLKHRLLVLAESKKPRHLL